MTAESDVIKGIFRRGTVFIHDMDALNTPSPVWSDCLSCVVIVLIQGGCVEIITVI